VLIASERENEEKERKKERKKEKRKTLLQRTFLNNVLVPLVTKK
jgi:hypothetical protein